MEKSFWALRVLATLQKILAWIILIGGILLAVLLIAIGAIQTRAGTPSPSLSGVPLMNQATGLLPAIALAVGMLLSSVVFFVFLYAAAEFVHLGLSIEHNTRETAHYLSGENLLPPPPVAKSWQDEEEPYVEEVRDQ